MKRFRSPKKLPAVSVFLYPIVLFIRPPESTPKLEPGTTHLVQQTSLNAELLIVGGIRQLPLAAILPDRQKIPEGREKIAHMEMLSASGGPPPS